MQIGKDISNSLSSKDITIFVRYLSIIMSIIIITSIIILRMINQIFFRFFKIIKKEQNLNIYFYFLARAGHKPL